MHYSIGISFRLFVALPVVYTHKNKRSNKHIDVTDFELQRRFNAEENIAKMYSLWVLKLLLLQVGANQLMTSKFWHRSIRNSETHKIILRSCIQPN